LWEAQQRIGACGDWCADGRIEGAYLSGLALAAELKATL
jgi:predicted NAD/FAD-dependent oxidoreductase